jgi:hypothetical protein
MNQGSEVPMYLSEIDNCCAAEYDATILSLNGHRPTR